MRLKSIWTALLFLLAGGLFAQGVGSVSGRVLDEETGEEMIGVTVIVDGAQLYAVTSIDGSYFIPNVPAGSQRLKFQMAGYKTSQGSVTVKPGANVAFNTTMGYQTFDTVVVTAKRVSNTDAALLTKMKKSAAAQDAISSEQIAKSPDSDAADAAKRVTGVSIMGGKYLFVRGLSERYSTIAVNDSPVPSPLPSRKVVPLDIFPVALLDNMIIAKTYLPNMPGDFGGGSVQLNTKDFPEEEEMKLSIGMGGNSETTGKDFRSVNGSALDWMGWGAGERALPSTFPAKKEISSGYYSNEQRIAFANDMRNSYSGKMISAMPSASLAFNYGNTFRMENNQQIGFLGSFSQKNSYQNLNDAIYRVYDTGGTKVDQVYDESVYSTGMTAQLAVAYRMSNAHQFKYNTFYTHQSENTAKLRHGYLSLGKSTGTEYNSLYEETGLWFNQAAGEHSFHMLTDDTQLRWRTAYSLVTRDQPDTSNALYNATGSIDSTRPITKYFNNHFEHTMQAAAELEQPFKQWWGLKSKLQLGNDYQYKFRANEGRRFQLVFSDTFSIDNGSALPEDVVQANKDNLMVNEITGTDQSTGLDSYDATLFVNGSYGMVDMPLFRMLRFVAGARAETWKQTVAAYSVISPDKRYITAINGLDILPSANLILTPIDKMNVRLGYSKTLNRPEFIEMGYLAYYDDAGTGFIIKGNPELEKADIDNADLRIEFFPAAAELIAVSGFYKRIQNPIEATINVADDPTYTYANQNKAELYGAEFEWRQSYGFIHKAIEGVSTSINYTYLYSKLELNPDLGSAETEARRPLQGMSPYLLNAGLYYDLSATGTDFALLYNLFGPRIVFVGVNGLEPTYEEPYHQLDFTVAQKVMKNGKLKLAIGNLLDETVEQYLGDDSERKLTLRYKKGTSYSVGYTHTL